jgi:hypothetical protein
MKQKVPIGDMNGIRVSDKDNFAFLINTFDNAGDRRLFSGDAGLRVQCREE